MVNLRVTAPAVFATQAVTLAHLQDERVALLISTALLTLNFIPIQFISVGLTCRLDICKFSTVQAVVGYASVNPKRHPLLCVSLSVIIYGQ